MKLITLNTWGGKLLTPLLKYIEESKDVDIFCFQEMYSSPEKKKMGRDMQSNLFEEIFNILPQHKEYFAPHLKGYDLEGKVDFALCSGLAIFIKKSIQVKDTGSIWLYREGYDLIDNDNRTVPRNLQYVRFVDNNQDYLVGHFHGIWYPKTKVDNEERIEQSKSINQFFNAHSGKKILCGDFNLLPATESMKILEEGKRNLIKDFHIETTRNEYYQRGEKHADYVLISPDVKVIDFTVIKTLVSDHYPLLFEYN